ncbi:hypothetical protein [Streptomyces sp. NPDC059378]|uniref:hypothetical protein n=1 Tax=Streptomyces sp. NPDC059378 TaxID=3346815 RepID=UPI00369AF7AC
MPASADTYPGTAEPPPTDGTVELFPMNFTSYQHHDDLDTEQHVRAIADLLAPYGPYVNPWTVPGDKRDRQAVEHRLGIWCGETSPLRGGNTLLYWVGHGSATALAHCRTPKRISSGVSAQDIASAIGDRQLDPGAENSWAIVVLDACFSRSFAQDVQDRLRDKYRTAGRYLLLSTAAEDYAELGSFTEALKRALTVTFRGQPSIGLASLGIQLASDLGVYPEIRVDDRRDQLVRALPDIATAVSAPLDQLAELQAVIDQLPTDEQRHFLPKASGAELGELAWYFHGRSVQRDDILRWLATATHGILAVTGPAGSGKSALLGHVLLHTRSQLRDILIRHEHLQPLPPGTPCPDDPFDLVAHLSGITLARTLHLVAEAAGLTDLARQAADGHPNADLTTRLLTHLRARRTPLTLLFDALDEAEQPLTIADTLLRPLAALPTVRIIIGTRRSTREGPDQPAPTDTDILDALQPRPTSDVASPVPDLQYVEVPRDPEALAGYLRAKLHAAKHRGALDVDDSHIATAVHRLVTDHHLGGAEPQQFLYARLAAHELLNDPGLLTDPTPLIGRTHRQLFTRALHRLHLTNLDYTPLLQALGLAQGRGLPDQDGVWACAANALTTTPADTGASISALLRDAAPYLALDQEHGQSVYRLAHRAFTEHFTTAHDTAQTHAHLTAALTHHALQTRGSSDGTDPALKAVSPYIRHHLAAHARLGHTVGALDTLAERTDVLDTLDLASITALHHGLPSNELPPAIAGTILLQHYARITALDPQAHGAIGWRRWYRRLGTTYIQGTTPPTETHVHDADQWPPALIAGANPRRQLHLQLTGDTRGVNAVAVFTAADGTPRLASAGDDRTVRIWNPATGTQDGEALTGHTDSVNAVAVFTAADGTPRLASASDDKTVRIWNPATGTQDGEALTGHTSWVRAVAVFTAADGTPRLASASSDGTMRIWNPATHAQDGEAHTGYTGYGSAVRAVAAFTAADGTPRLVSVGDDTMLRFWIWNPATLVQDVSPFPSHRDLVLGLEAYIAARPSRPVQDGQPLTTRSDLVLALEAYIAARPSRPASAGDDKVAQFWVPSGLAQDGRPLTGHNGDVNAVAVFTAADGTPRLATASRDGTMRIWNPATRAQDGQWLTDHARGVHGMAVFTAADGTARLATASSDGTMRIWNPATGTQDGEALTGHTGWVRAVAVFTAADGTPRLASAGSGGTVRIWNPATRAQGGQRLAGLIGGVDSLAVFTAADGTVRLATASSDGPVRIWNLVTGTQDGEAHTGHTNRVHGMAVFTAADGTPRLATASRNGTMRIWNPATRTQDGQALTGHTDWVNAVAVFTAADGAVRLATASSDGTMRIWNPATGTQDGEALTGHTRGVHGMAVFTAADGTPRLASVGSGRTVRIWNPATRAQDGQFPTGHTNEVDAVAVFTAADGTPRLASASDDKTVRIWNPATGTQDGEALTGHTDWVRAVAVFTAVDGTPRLATASKDGTLRIWNPRTRTAHTLPLPDQIYSLTEHRGLLIAGTSAGYLAIDVSSVPADPAGTSTPNVPAQDPRIP